ncbi:MAG: TerB family tellurite resistance protein [Polyangiaceae bacterium]|nr:TerB family tellurite resistance protein [Polyangiaceae bacterium]
MDEPTSLQICGLIAGVLASDGHMHAHEASFLQRVRTRLGLPPGARVAPVLDRDDAIGKLRGLPEEVRKETLELLIQAAAADGKVSPAERALLDAVAGELQVPAAELDVRLDSAIATSRPQPFEPDDGG